MLLSLLPVIKLFETIFIKFSHARRSVSLVLGEVSVLLTRGSRVEMNPSETPAEGAGVCLDQRVKRASEACLLRVWVIKKMERITPGFMTLLLNA